MTLVVFSAFAFVLVEYAWGQQQVVNQNSHSINSTEGAKCNVFVLLLCAIIDF
jgi:hypothetical protein